MINLKLETWNLKLARLEREKAYISPWCRPEKLEIVYRLWWIAPEEVIQLNIAPLTEF